MWRRRHDTKYFLNIILESLKRIEAKMSQLDDEINELKNDVAASRSVVDSAITLINGIADRVADAVKEALAAGATPEQLQAVTDLSAAVKAESADLGAAVQANTPAAQP